MTYDGNRLQSLTDGLHAVNRPDSEDSGGAATTVDGYSYDLNGNMTNEPGCGIVSISYNRNNQPAEITCLNSVESLTYLPDGTKFRRSVLMDDNTLSVTEYRGNLVYENDSLRYVLVDGGLIDMNYSEPQYQFFLKDHLGGTRVVAKANGTVVQMNHYYPYGGSFADNKQLAFHEVHQTLPGIGDILEDGDNKVNLDNVSKDDSQLTIYDKSTASGFTTSGDSGDGAVIGGAVPEENGSVAMGYSRQPYRFSGNEQYSETGLYDFKARQYSPSIARFLSIDPMAEKYCSVSPYSYCAGNPVMFVDPEGKDFRRKYRGNTIYISATYYTNSISEPSAKQAIAFWNERKEDTYVDKAGKEYKIVYRLNLKNTEIDMTREIEQGENTNRNTYSVDDRLVKRAEATGNTKYDKHIAVRKSYSLTKPGTSEESTTGAHEIGHTLGMGHKDTGIMTRAQDDSRTRDVPQSNIDEMIESESGKDDILTRVVHLYNRIIN